MTTTVKQPSLSTRIATFAMKSLWMTVASLLVLFALLMSLMRYSLPYLNEHKDKLEGYFANQYQIDLTIDELSASWKSKGPALILRGVNIKKGENSPIELFVGEVYVEVEFWPSIASLSFQSNQVVLNNLIVETDLSQLKSEDDDFPIVEALEHIFLDQLSNFTVANSLLVLVSGDAKDVVNIKSLTWLNRLNRHQGIGQFSLENVKSSQANFILDLYGNLKSYSGTLYASAVDVDLSSWINQFTGLNTQLLSSKGNLQLWGAITNGEITRVDGQLLPSTFTWNMQSEFENKVSANFAAINSNSNWNFSVADATISTDGEEFVTHFNGHYSNEKGLSMRMAEPVSLKSLRPLSGLYSIELSDTLALIDADAYLTDFAMIFDESGANVHANLVDVSWSEFDSIIGLDNAKVDLYWHDNVGKIALESVNSNLGMTTFLKRDVSIDRLNVPIFVDMHSKIVEIDNAFLDSKEASFSLTAQYNLENSFLSLVSNAQPVKLNKVPLLLPDGLLGRETKAFLSKAFTGDGNVTQAELLYHGELEKFPFLQNEGVFQSRILVEDGDFLFSNRWPILKGGDVEASFENKKLVLQSLSAKLGDVQLYDIRAEIPEFSKNAQLTITADASATSSQVTNLLLNSTLKSNLGSLLSKDLILNGDLSGNLKLEIPLINDTTVRAIGEVAIDAPTFYIPAVDMTLTNAQGEVEFDNENIRIQGLNAQLWQQPLVINVQGRQRDTYDINIDANGDWDSSIISMKLGEGLVEYSDGTANVALDLDMNFTKNTFKYAGSIKSDLKNLTLNLPRPFVKSSDETLDLEILASGDNTASRIDITLGELAYFDGALAHKERRFNRAHLALGPTEFETRGVGFSISGTFDTFYADQWYQFIDALVSPNKKSSNSIIGIPQRIFMNTQRMVYKNQVFTDLDITARRLSSQWEIDVDSNEARGQISLFDEWFSRGLVADFEYVKISTNEPKTAHDSFSANRTIENKNRLGNFDPKSLPSINITCKHCEFNEKSLGRIALEAQPNNDGLELSRILVENEFGTLRSSGQWYKRNQDHYTFISGDLNSSEFGRFLADLGTPNGIEDSSADMNFALTWKNSPLDLTFSELDGEIEWQLSDGYLSDVSDKGSRLFTLLSLNSLVRKLSLDFRDVFAKGFFYDNMSGSVQITQGKADTRDTAIDGAAGEIEIYGYTDLTNNNLNYNVSFTPNVTGNLPVLVYFFTVSPPSALAALALDQVLTSAKVISNVNYSVTGTIDDPVLIETGRESTEVELPTRRQIPIENDIDTFFKPPTEDDLVDLEVKNVKSD